KADGPRYLRRQPVVDYGGRRSTTTMEVALRWQRRTPARYSNGEDEADPFNHSSFVWSGSIPGLSMATFVALRRSPVNGAASPMPKATADTKHPGFLGTGDDPTRQDQPGSTP
ncbi:MAG: hypothetical protein OSB43_20430, partial [Nocardioides sp.]|uniref:hypothetical protein n=1 Tax=Nocardioides sp. TaxID=35761 RepID=UPI00238D5DC2